MLATVVFAGCADNSGPDLAETGQKLERGITGQGTLYQRDHAEDPFVNNEGR